MSLNEADTRAKLIDPAIHKCGWTEELIRREETAGTVEIINGKARRRARGKIDYVLRVKVNVDKGLLLRDYLARFLTSGIVKEFIHERTNTVGQPKLALTRIATIPVPLPPLDEQRRIAEMLREQMVVIEHTSAVAEEELAPINALPAVLLRRAFAGEL